jgi:hypothetical protein
MIMKRLILFIALSFSISSFSQNEFFPDDSASWTGSYITWCGPGCAMGGWIQVTNNTISPDSIVGSYSYKKLNYSYNDFNLYHYALYRIDTLEEQLWWIPQDSTTEFMFFDFDEAYMLGDTISIPHYLYLNNFQISNWIIGSIDSTEINGSYYKEWNLNWGEEMTISERLINSKGFPFLQSFYFETQYNLACYQESEIGLLGNCPWNEYNFGSFEGNEAEIFSIYPNPSSGPVTFLFENTQERNIEIYNAQGSLIMFSVCNTNQLELDVNLPDGLYVVKVRSNQTCQTEKFIIE